MTDPPDALKTAGPETTRQELDSAHAAICSEFL